MFIVVPFIILGFIIFIIRYYDKHPTIKRSKFQVIKLALLCAFGCSLGAVLGGPVAIFKTVMLMLSLFAVIPLIEKARLRPRNFQMLWAGFIGGSAGALAGVANAYVCTALGEFDFSFYNLTMLESIAYCALYGLLIHLAFKAFESRGKYIRFLGILAAMCIVFVLKFHGLVFQLQQPWFILIVFLAAPPSCIVVALLWWNPAERFKALCHQGNDQEIQFVSGKENERITFWAIIICFILGIPMMMLAMENRNALFEIRNSNTEIKKSITGTIIACNTIYNCISSKNLYSAKNKYSWLMRGIFDFKKNIICYSSYRDTEIRSIDSPENAPIKINEAFDYLSISPDLQRIACLKHNKKISIFDLATKKIVKEFKGEYPDSLCWTADSKKLFVVLNSNICELNLLNGTVKKLFPGDMPRLLPSGKISFRDNNKIVVWNSATDEKTIAFKSIPDNFRTYCFSPCEKYIAFVRQGVNTITHAWGQMAVCKAYSNSRGEILHKISFCFNAHTILWVNIDSKTLNMLNPQSTEKTKK
jgi:hypothetical protein